MKRLAILGLAVLGLARMAGDVFGLAPLAGLAAATGASPAPKVFSAVDGLETYWTSFALAYEDTSGTRQIVALTPALYARLRGPYNRRNAYGAILAYGPVLVNDARTRPMWNTVSRFALCGDAPLLREIGIDPASVASPVTVLLEPREGTHTDLPLALEVSCS